MTHFFSGSNEAKVDAKNRFVLPQAMRYGLVDEGKLEFVLALGLGGCLSIYRKSDIEKIVDTFKKNSTTPSTKSFSHSSFSLFTKQLAINLAA